ncbi:MAG: hypothetical protein LBV72_11835 [Tannerella sp.]|jgi:hypothetical protein|nr:hypothetical protein [Tannerella sp.]
MSDFIVNLQQSGLNQVNHVYNTSGIVPDIRKGKLIIRRINRVYSRFIPNSG